MLELPESNYLAKQVGQYLKGKIIGRVEVLHTPHKFAFFKGEVKEYPDLLEGKTITGARQCGGMLRIDLEDVMIVFSDGASLKYYENAENFPKTHQMAIYFDDETALFMSVRMYAMVYACYPYECTEDYYQAAVTKPDVLSEEFTYEYFRAQYPADGKKLSAKAFLATNQRFPGIGNGVLQDILWDAGIDPRFDMSKLDEKGFQQLYHSVRNILQKMCDEGGRDTENDLFGNKGGYVSQLSKNSYMEPCMRCGTLIGKANYLGGTIYFCEKCQAR